MKKFTLEQSEESPIPKPSLSSVKQASLEKNILESVDNSSFEAGCRGQVVGRKHLNCQQTLLDKQKIYQVLHRSNFDSPLNLHLFDSLDSTNRFLKEYPLSSAIEVCCAETQTQGRGRFGRHWHSPFGENIYCSSRWHFNCSIAKLSGLSLVSSLAVMATLQDFSAHNEVRIKWPNDLLWREQKLCGSLIEVMPERNEGIDVIIGIGLNVNSETQYHTIPDKAWCSLYDILSTTLDRNVLIAKLLTHLHHYLNLFVTHGFSKFTKLWKEFDYLAGKSITVSHATLEISGIAAGIDNSGQLMLIDTTGNTHYLSAGETSLSKY